MTPAELAMCKDALEAAGVPQQVIAEFTGPRHCGTHGTQRIGVTSTIPDWATGALPKSVVDVEKHNMYLQLMRHLLENKLADFRESRGRGVTKYSLELNVVPPAGWTPPNVR